LALLTEHWHRPDLESAAAPEVKAEASYASNEQGIEQLVTIEAFTLDSSDEEDEGGGSDRDTENERKKPQPKTRKPKSEIEKKAAQTMPKLAQKNKWLNGKGKLRCVQLRIGHVCGFGRFCIFWLQFPWLIIIIIGWCESHCSENLWHRTATHLHPSFFSIGAFSFHDCSAPPTPPIHPRPPHDTHTHVQR
jgi:hypothetical protein